jgi:hypothetical protein
MNRNTLALAAAAIVAVSGACSSSQPATPTPVVAAVVIPKLTAPSLQSPANGQLLTGLTATLTASAATADMSTLVLQYRFQIFNDAGTLVFDSGLVSSPTWTTTTLSPNKRFTWKSRAEADGWIGPWSDTATFNTPDPPPAYSGAIGNWQACAGLKSTTLVTCVWNTIHPTNSVGDLEVVKRVAWLLRSEGGGLLIKASGDNVVLWQGYSFSASRVCFPDGHIYKIISDAGPGGANGPGFADNDFVDKSFYVPAIDPSKP